jgi:hypothetical protein
MPIRVCRGVRHGLAAGSSRSRFSTGPQPAIRHGLPRLPPRFAHSPPSDPRRQAFGDFRRSRQTFLRLLAIDCLFINRNLRCIN